MEKVRAILEKKIEWIALGLGLLWVLFVVWTYGINSPVAVEIGSQNLTPGAVDEAIRTEAEELSRIISSNKVPDLNVSPVTDELAKLLGDALPQPLATIPVWSAPQAPVVAKATPTAVPGGVKVDTPKVAVDVPPDPPVPTDLQVKTFQSLVMKFIPPTASGAPGGEDPTAVPAGVVAPSVITPGGAAAGDGADAGALADGAMPADAVEKRCAQIFAKFNVNALAAEFTKAKVPASLNAMHFVEVQMERQEVLADGKDVGTPVLVAKLPMHVAPFDRQKQFREWLEWVLMPETQIQILQPDFYGWVAGDELPLPPYMTSAEAAPLVPADGPFDPLATWEMLKLMTPKDQHEALMKLTPEQRRQVTKARQDAEERDRRDKASQRGTQSTDSRRTMPVRGGTLENDPRFSSGRTQQAPTRGNLAGDPRFSDPRAAAYNRGRLTADPRFGYGRPGLSAYRGGQAQTVNHNLTPDKDGNIWIWAYDETAAPERLYKYRMRVVVKNPVYQASNIVKTELASILELPIPENVKWSEWTKPVTIPAPLKFQLAGPAIGRDKDQVRFNVWRFHKGKMTKSSESFVVSPGDMIGGTKGDVDFSTGWTVADVQQAGGDTRVILVNDEGRTQTRSLRSDSIDPQFRDPDPDPTDKITPVSAMR